MHDGQKVKKSSSPFLSRKPPNSRVSKEEKASLGDAAGLLPKPSRPAQEPPNSGSTVVEGCVHGGRGCSLSCCVPTMDMPSFNLFNNPSVPGHLILPTKETEAQSSDKNRMKHRFLYPFWKLLSCPELEEVTNMSILPDSRCNTSTDRWMMGLASSLAPSLHCSLHPSPHPSRHA